MAKRIINVDGYIGDGGFSAQYIKNALVGAEKEEVELRINSLGGDAGHAIAIKDALQAHGNVTALYSGASASSGTLIGMGCKSVKMTKDSFWLVHKPMMSVDIWAAMNEDELKDLIAKLSDKLDNATKWTLQLAGIYCDKTGKPAKQILDVMKKGAWLNAEEAKNLGFVDEVITPDTITNWAEDEKMVALVAGQTDMPPLPRKSVTPPAAAVEDLATKIEKAGDTLLNKFINLFSNHKINTDMPNSNVYALLCVVLALSELKPDDKGSIVLNKEQLDKIEAEIKKLQDAKVLAESNLAIANTAKDKAIADLTAANTAKDTAVSALTTATTAMDELGATVKAATEPVKKVEAIRTLLAAKPGAAAAGIQNQSDGTHKTIEGADEVSDYVKSIV